MDLGSVSKLSMTVAPVVVKPENDSKNAEARFMSMSELIRNGIAPTLPSAAQNNTTIKKPSRTFKSVLNSLLGIHRIKPINRVTLNAAKKSPPPAPS